MKNFQQTPKQSRKAKAEMAGQKAALRASNPKHTFEQVYVNRGPWYGLTGKLRNLVGRTGKL